MEGAKIFIKVKDKFLFILRDNDSEIANPNKWSVVGGAIEEGEDPDETIIRETKEEIGLKIKNPTFLEVIDTHYYKKRIRKPVKIYIFKYKDDELNIDNLNLKEGQKMDLFTLKEALELDLSPGLRDFIERKLI